MILSQKQRHFLRGLAHDRKPVVIIGGAGLTENVLLEIDSALAHHELIKVRVNADNREARKQMIDEITAKTASELIQSIGHIACFFRRAEKPVIDLPKN
ncbi:MAG: ribosome assembly RNA-binding protein YhbY [Gammaproteobacteria bacterium]|nr:ribosome assembly RNA-binding protein YhbY [Gammaproteobacteria bacterium]